MRMHCYVFMVYCSVCTCYIYTTHVVLNKDTDGEVALLEIARHLMVDGVRDVLPSQLLILVKGSPQLRVTPASQSTNRS